MSVTTVSIIALLTFTIRLILVRSANILFVSMPNSESHWRSMQPLAEKLASVGHNVTMLQEAEHFQIKTRDIHENKEKNVKLFHELRVELNMDQASKENSAKYVEYVLWHQAAEVPQSMMLVWRMGLNWTKALIQQRYDLFQNILNQNWDLFIIDSLYTPTGVALASLSKTPYLIFYATVASIMEGANLAIPRPTSYLPTCRPQKQDYEHRNFLERLKNVIYTLNEIVSYRLIDAYYVRPLLMEMFGSDKGLDEFYSGQRLSFFDHPKNLDLSIPSTANSIQLGARCNDDKVQDLPADLEMFVEDEKSRGTIVLAFGHLVDWRTAPNQIVQNLARALNRLQEYRIVWQLNRNASDLTLSNHVKIMRWIPQLSLLKHRKTKLLVMHGGVKSLMEAICFGQPTLIIPFFAEHMYNALVIKDKKCGLILEKWQLYDENAIFNIIRRVLRNRTIKSNIRRMKSIAGDRIISDDELGKFWTEFSIRHKNVGISRFQLRSVRWGIFVYYNFDVAMFFLLLCVSFASLFYAFAVRLKTHL